MSTKHLTSKSTKRSRTTKAKTKKITTTLQGIITIKGNIHRVLPKLYFNLQILGPRFSAQYIQFFPNKYLCISVGIIHVTIVNIDVFLIRKRSESSFFVHFLAREFSVDKQRKEGRKN